MDILGETYRDGRADLIRFLRTLDDSQASVTVLATPEWTVKQVVAHMVGIVEDAISGNMDGVTTDPWTAAQVARSESTSMDQLLANWETYGPMVDDVIVGGGDTDRIVADLVCHEHDIRGALGLAGNRDSGAMAYASGLVVDSWPERCVAAGLPVVIPAADRFEQFRARFGRRSRSQIEGMFAAAGSSQPAAHATAFVIFGTAANDIFEP